MLKIDHKRRFDGFEKFYLHVASATIIALLGWNATSSAENKNATIALNVAMTNIVEEVRDVKANQSKQTGEITKIKNQVVRMCDRQNLHWDGHQIPCGDDK